MAEDTGSFTLLRALNADSSGCSYTLHDARGLVKMWRITYGYCTQAWQEQEKADKEKMVADLKAMGLDFHELNTERLG